jgi:hypothetical protein
LVCFALGCGGGPTNEVVLVGQVYDGASGTLLTSYTMSVLYRDQTLKAKVSATGRFVVEHLPVFQDYTVQIDSDGYRTFRSHNAMFNVPNPNALSRPDSSLQTFYYDAYLFPSNLMAEAVSLSVRKDTATGDPASGKVRIRPTSESLLDDTSAEIPAGVLNQVWLNDEDLQTKAISRDFAGGMIAIAAGELVYGVRYLVDVFEVTGYQPFEGQITAGIDGSRTLVLSAETSDPLMLVMTSAGTCTKPTGPTDTAAAVVSFQLNQPIEFSMSTYPGGFPEMVDDNFTINWPNTNFDANQNTLATDASSTVQEHGTTTVISGNTITFSWNAQTGLATKDPADTFGYARWNVGQVQIQPVGKPAQKQLLGALYPNASFINCQ